MRLFILVVCAGSLGCEAKVLGSEDVPVDVTPAVDTAPEIVEAATDLCAGGTGTETGEAIRAIAVTDCDGSPVAVSDVLSQSKLLLISLAAGWCAPCREEQDELQALFDKYGKCGLEVVVILTDPDVPGEALSSAFCNTWVGQYELTVRVWADRLRELKDFIGPGGLPVNMLVTPDCLIQAKQSEVVDADFEAVIEGFLGSCQAPTVM